MLPLLLLLQAAPPPRLTQFLQQRIGLDAAQLATVERGEPVVKVLETRDRRDVALFGIVTAPALREEYVRALRNFATSLRTPTRTRVGISRGELSRKAARCARGIIGRFGWRMASCAIRRASR